MFVLEAIIIPVVSTIVTIAVGWLIHRLVCICKDAYYMAREPDDNINLDELAD